MTNKEIEIMEYNKLQHNNWWSAVCKLVGNGSTITIDEAIALTPQPKYK